MPKRLVFLFYSDGPTQPDSIPKFDPKAISVNKYAKQFFTDGLYYVFQRLIEIGTLEEVLIVTESNRSPGFLKTDFPGIQSIIIPHISCLDNLLRPDDIIFTRGGFRSWHDWLIARQKEGYWMWLYAANTGRQRWPFWDLILEDCHNWDTVGKTDRLGRHHLDYRKPINPTYFYPTDDPKYEYDFMIGASYITDKKGQWRTIQALKKFRELYGYSPRCIMPGATRRGTKTLKMLEYLNRNSDLDIEMPGMLNRQKLAVLMRKTKVFIHSGASGQNDRGPLEAMACGCRLILHSPQYHHPLLSSNCSLTITCDCNNLEDFTGAMRSLMSIGTDGILQYREQILEFFRKTHEVEMVVIPDFQRILNFFDAYPQRSNDAKEALAYALR